MERSGARPAASSLSILSARRRRPAVFDRPTNSAVQRRQSWDGSVPAKSDLAALSDPGNVPGLAALGVGTSSSGVVPKDAWQPARATICRPARDDSRQALHAFRAVAEPQPSPPSRRRLRVTGASGNHVLSDGSRRKKPESSCEDGASPASARSGSRPPPSPRRGRSRSAREIASVTSPSRHRVTAVRPLSSFAIGRAHADHTTGTATHFGNDRDRRRPRRRAFRSRCRCAFSLRVEVRRRRASKRRFENMTLTVLGP